MSLLEQFTSHSPNHNSLPLTFARHLKAPLFGWWKIIYDALYKSTHHHPLFHTVPYGQHVSETRFSLSFLRESHSKKVRNAALDYFTHVKYCCVQTDCSLQKLEPVFEHCRQFHTTVTTVRSSPCRSTQSMCILHGSGHL